MYELATYIRISPKNHQNKTGSRTADFDQSWRKREKTRIYALWRRWSRIVVRVCTCTRHHTCEFRLRHHRDEKSYIQIRHFGSFYTGNVCACICVCACRGESANGIPWCFLGGLFCKMMMRFPSWLEQRLAYVPRMRVCLRACVYVYTKRKGWSSYIFMPRSSTTTRE